MYQVIKMYGNMEPWWFFEDWKENIVAVKEFENYYQALKYYKKEWFSLFQKKSYFNSRNSIMSAFWDQTDNIWCTDCNDYLQQYHSVVLLKDWKEIPKAWKRPGYEMAGRTSHYNVYLNNN
ncbi:MULTISPECIES: DUF1033 family protein [unclassified Streptococcus]|uniref:DUF1033 family protein n=1 Tax=unclassified Streptococcus TaxID=2608887 RepID=UPI0011B6505B|nr:MULTISPECIES: DUF1033 family protein [unclassified Streptococcus]TWT09822.1 DUF1033 family protein [Streptococcus sp. sy004]TWT13393.1 DUF1033 family protein [Streptococcus sp. sy010]